jgi:putative MATE family efflux protein
VVTGAALLANAALAPFLVYGWGPFPVLGVAGSGLATVVCMAGAVAAYAGLALCRHPDLPIHLPSLGRPDGRMLSSLARVGAPYAAVSSLFSLVYLFYAHLAARDGAAAVAVIGIGNRLESITYLTADGFAVAAATFVGQNLGAGNATRAERGAWRAMGAMAGFGLAMTAVMLALPRELLSVFTEDPRVIELGVPYVRVVGLCQLFTAVEGVIGGAFAGAGDTVPPMTVHVGFALARIPLAAWAVGGLGLGIMGVAWTMSVTCMIRGVVLALWFRRGRWKHRLLPGIVPQA